MPFRTSLLWWSLGLQLAPVIGYGFDALGGLDAMNWFGYWLFDVVPEGAPKQSVWWLFSGITTYWFLVAIGLTWFGVALALVLAAVEESSSPARRTAWFIAIFCTMILAGTIYCVSQLVRIQRRGAGSEMATSLSSQ